jgi:hypothetical protein
MSVGVLVRETTESPPGFQSGWRRHATRLLIGSCIALLLLAVGELAPSLFPVRVAIEGRANSVTVIADGNRKNIQMPDDAQFRKVRFEQPGPAEHELQIDGSDTVGRQDRDRAYINALSTTPLYMVAAWLRDESSFSRWEDVRLVDLDTGQVIADGRTEVEAAVLPSAFRLEASLRHPEAPATIWLIVPSGQFEEGLRLDRNNRTATWTRDPPTRGADTVSWFYPEEPRPFAANLVQLAGRTAATALGLFLVIALIGLGLTRFSLLTASAARAPKYTARFVALFLVGAALAASGWITLVLYQQLPHIVDAAAYYLQAGMFASGHIYFEPPPLGKFFINYNQVLWDHRWFAQYPPGAALSYAAGRVVGLAWLVGPLASICMVVATAHAARTWYGGRVGLLVLALGCLSPFILFMAGTYMSHPIAGAAVGAALAFFALGDRSGQVRFPAPAGRSREISFFALSGVALGCAFLTRETSAVLFALPLVVWLLLQRRWSPLIAMVAAALPFICAYLAYDAMVTGNPLTLPRSIVNGNDHLGFGNVGFLGRHTLAAGLVNADQDLNSLQFDLFGWPPLLALSVMCLPFVLGRAGRRDLMLASGAMLFVVTLVGFYAHGTGAMGPRYYYEALPWFLLLSARGLQSTAHSLQAFGLTRVAARTAVITGVGILTLYAATQYYPQLVNRRTDFAALANGERYSYPFIAQTLFGPELRGFDAPTLVLVPDEDIFKTLSAMNCANLDASSVMQCPVLFLHAGENDAPAVRAAYPDREILTALPEGTTVVLTSK